MRRGWLRGSTRNLLCPRPLGCFFSPHTGGRWLPSARRPLSPCSWVMRRGLAPYRAHLWRPSRRWTALGLSRRPPFIPPRPRSPFPCSRVTMPACPWSAATRCLQPPNRNMISDSACSVEWVPLLLRVPGAPIRLLSMLHPISSPSHPSSMMSFLAARPPLVPLCDGTSHGPSSLVPLLCIASARVLRRHLHRPMHCCSIAIPM